MTAEWEPATMARPARFPSAVPAGRLGDVAERPR